MHVYQGFEPIGGHVLEWSVADDSRIVDHDVHSAPGAKGGVDDRSSAFGAGHAVGVGDGLTAALPDLLRDDVRGLGVGADPGHRSADVVDHDARPACSEQQRVLLAQTGAGAGDHGDLLVESQFVGHQLTGSSFIP